MDSNGAHATYERGRDVHRSAASRLEARERGIGGARLAVAVAALGLAGGMISGPSAMGPLGAHGPRRRLRGACSGSCAGDARTTEGSGARPLSYAGPRSSCAFVAGLADQQRAVSFERSSLHGRPRHLRAGLADASGGRHGDALRRGAAGIAAFSRASERLAGRDIGSSRSRARARRSYRLSRGLGDRRVPHRGRATGPVSAHRVGRRHRPQAAVGTSGSLVGVTGRNFSLPWL